MSDTAYNERERRFIQAYVGEALGNGTKAAVLAGYSAHTARQTASRLLARPRVQELIEKQRIRANVKASLDAQAILTELTSIATAPVESVKAAEKIKALELLGKREGLFQDRAPDSRITVNIGFLNGAAPTVDVIETTAQVMPEVIQVMPARPHVASEE